MADKVKIFHNLDDLEEGREIEMNLEDHQIISNNKLADDDEVVLRNKEMYEQGQQDHVMHIKKTIEEKAEKMDFYINNTKKNLLSEYDRFKDSKKGFYLDTDKARQEQLKRISDKLSQKNKTKYVDEESTLNFYKDSKEGASKVNFVTKNRTKLNRRKRKDKKGPDLKLLLGELKSKKIEEQKKRSLLPVYDESLLNINPVVPKQPVYEVMQYTPVEPELSNQDYVDFDEIETEIKPEAIIIQKEPIPQPEQEKPKEPIIEEENQLEIAQPQFDVSGSTADAINYFKSKGLIHKQVKTAKESFLDQKLSDKQKKQKYKEMCWASQKKNPKIMKKIKKAKEKEGKKDRGRAMDRLLKEAHGKSKKQFIDLNKL